MSTKMFPKNKKEQLSIEMEHRKQYETLIRSMCDIDHTAFQNQLDRRRYEEKEEQNIEGTLTTDRKMAEEREYKRLQNEKVAEELDRQNRLCTRDIKLRQQIRQNNQELRELEVKLRAAYVAKGLRAQMAENEAKKLQEKINTEREQEDWLEQKLADETFYRQKKENEKTTKQKFRVALQDQMAIKHQRNQILYQEFLREKKELDDIVQRVMMEQMTELQEKHMKKQRFRTELEELRKIQEMFNERQRQELEEENKRIAQFLVDLDRKEAERKRIAEENKKNSGEFVERMCAELTEAAKKKEQRDELLLLLKVEEVKEQEEKSMRKRLEEQFRGRLQTRLYLERQRRDNIARIELAQEEDRVFRQQQMEILAERDKIDQLTNERRRQQVMEHNRIVREILEKRKGDRSRQLAEAIEMERMNINENERIQQIIEEERIKMIREHASELVGFFPPGVLRASDRAILNLP